MCRDCAEWRRRTEEWKGNLGNYRPPLHFLRAGFDDEEDDETNINSFAVPSLGALLLYLEWHMSDAQTLAVAESVSAYFKTVLPTTLDAIRFHKKRGGAGPGSHRVKSLQFHRLLSLISDTVGPLYASAIDACCMGKDIFYSGMSPPLSKVTRHCTCGAARYLHRFCFSCGSIFDVKAEILATMQNKLPTLTAKQQALDPATRRLDLKTRCEEAALRVMERFFDFADSKQTLEHYGGVCAFLSRMLVVSVDEGPNRQFARRRFLQLTKKWIDLVQKIEVKDDNVNEIVTGLQNVKNIADSSSRLNEALYRRSPAPQASETSSPAPAKTYELLQRLLLPEETSLRIPLTEKTISDDPVFCKDFRTRGRRESPLSMPARAGSSISVLKRRPLQEALEQRDAAEQPMKKSRGSSDQSGGENSTEPTNLTEEASERAFIAGLDFIVSWCCNLEVGETPTFMRDVKEEMSHTDLNKFWGDCDPEESLPTAPPVCGSCHAILNKNASCCTNRDCESTLVMRPLDFSSVTDGMCYSYIYRGADRQIVATRNFLREIVKKLPIARSFVCTPDRMGNWYFQLQSYLVTHILFACSDYGQYPLQRQLFAPEFEFVVMAMPHMLKVENEDKKGVIGDVELVCEFVWALKLLGYTPERDPELEPLVIEATEYILKCEKKGLGSTPRSRGGKRSTGEDIDARQDKYHRLVVACHALSSFSSYSTSKHPLPTIAEYV